MVGSEAGEKGVGRFVQWLESFPLSHPLAIHLGVFREGIVSRRSRLDHRELVRHLQIVDFERLVTGVLRLLHPAIERR